MQRAGAIDYGISTIRNSDKARGRSNAPLPPDAMQFSCGLTARQMLAAESKSAGHPNEFVQEFVEATAVSGISDLAGGRIKKFSGVPEIDVRKNRDHAELA